MIRCIAGTGATTDGGGHSAASMQCAELNETGPEEAMMAKALSDKERALMDAYWRAAN